jgi:hypothetical protein
LKSWGLRFGGNLLPPETNQLINSRHELKTPYKIKNTPPSPSFAFTSQTGTINISKSIKKVKPFQGIFEKKFHFKTGSKP